MGVSMNLTGNKSVTLYFLGRYKLLHCVILVLILGGSALESLSVVAFFPMFSSVLNEAQEPGGGVQGFITSLAQTMPFTEPIVAAAALLFAIFVTKTLIVLTRDGLIAIAGAKILYDVKQQIFERYSDAHYRYILDTPQGELIYNSLSAPGSVSSLLLTGLRMVAALSKVIAITVVLFAMLPLAAGGLVALGAIYYAVMHYLSKRISFHLGQEKARVNTEQIVVTNEFLTGFRQIVVLNATKWWVQRFEQGNRLFSTLHAKDLLWSAVPRPIMELSAVTLMLGFILALWISSPETIAQDLPTTGVFAIALLQLMPPLTSFGAMRMSLMSSLPNAELAYETINGSLPIRQTGHRDLDSFEKSIEFVNVNFSYDGREPLLKDLSLSIEKGKVTALVGPSGGGKTTILNLILGLFEQASGSIKVDGIPIRELKPESWYNKIGFVSQDIFMFHSTVVQNILLGRQAHSTESIVKAAKIANAHGFVSELPEGYDTTIGERGMKLSGGQQQRLAIAAAVLNGPEILIFDEATSSLDNNSERQVQHAIDQVSNDRTVIIIAHRLSTIRHADKIVVIEHGRVVEEGDHQELMSRQGYYANLTASGR
jgi:ABC-type multidrug transport system fused ATPase/permease subunit